MIPIQILDNKGQLVGQQAFNDNLSPIEQVNRSILYTIIYAQQELTNAKNKIDMFFMSGQETTEDIEAIETATAALKKAVCDAVVAFNGVVDKTAVIKVEDTEPGDDGESKKSIALTENLEDNDEIM